jgi:sulfur-carrier protein
MNIRVRFFASLRETLGSGATPLLVPNEVMTVGELRAWLCLQSAAHAEALTQTKALRAALNQTMCADDAVLIEGAEVAFFPPVTGG